MCIYSQVVNDVPQFLSKPGKEEHKDTRMALIRVPTCPEFWDG